MTLKSVLALTSVVSLLSLLLSPSEDPIVLLEDTLIIGTRYGEVDFFGGIPYAEPPIGDLRLNFPVLSTTINAKTFDATRSGPGCLQTPPAPSGICEDCLTMDIYRPAGISPGPKLPVLFWIHGGGFIVGASSYYNGSSIVARSISRGTPIMFISANYRLGPLGFPRGIEAGQRRILNLGLHDQLVALEWIQENIHNFGGDKSRVAIQGESAGVLSIQTFLLHSRIKSLARAAIMQSGGPLPIFGPEHYEGSWQTYVAAIPSCVSTVGTNNTFDCIRRASSSSLNQAIIDSNAGFSNMSFFPVIDGPGGLIVNRFSRIKAMGNIPILHGANCDEGTLGTPVNISSTDEVQAILETLISPPLVSPDEVAKGMQKAMKLYPDIPALGSPFGTGDDTFGLSSQYKRFAAIMGDLGIHSSRRTLGQQMSANGVPVFAYHFMDRDAVVFPEFAPAQPSGPLGVAHSSEIPYVFGTLVNKTPDAAALSRVMQDYWISFVTSLDPNDAFGEKRPKWDRYVPGHQAVLSLNGKGLVMAPDIYREQQISFWQNNPDLLHR